MPAMPIADDPTTAGSAARDVAREIRKALLDDVKFVVDDIRQQYRDHNQLLARQELLVQQLLSEVHRLSSQNSVQVQPNGSNGSKCGPLQMGTGAFCLEPETGSHEDYLAGKTAPIATLVTLPAATTRSRMLARDAFATSPSNKVVARMSPRITSKSPPKPTVNPHPGSPRVALMSNGSTIGTHDGANVIFGKVEGYHYNCPGDVDACPHSPQEKPTRLSSGTTSSPVASSVERNTWQGKLSLEAQDENLATATTTSRAYSRKEQTRNYEFGSSPWRPSVVGGPSPGCQLFGDMNAERPQLDVEEYNVCDLYQTSGIAQRIARSDLFANITLAVISVNAVYIGVDADHNDKDSLAESDIGFQICENAFCAFFHI
jgi:hypothetical protein